MGKQSFRLMINGRYQQNRLILKKKANSNLKRNIQLPAASDKTIPVKTYLSLYVDFESFAHLIFLGPLWILLALFWIFLALNDLF